MGGDDVGDEGEAQPRAFGFVHQPTLDAVERLVDALLLLGRDTDAPVSDAQEDRATCYAGANLEFRKEPTRIREKDTVTNAFVSFDSVDVTLPFRAFLAAGGSGKR